MRVSDVMPLEAKTSYTLYTHTHTEHHLPDLPLDLLFRLFLYLVMESIYPTEHRQQTSPFEECKD